MLNEAKEKFPRSGLMKPFPMSINTVAARKERAHRCKWESKAHNTIPPVRGNPFIGPHRARLLGRATDAAGSQHDTQRRQRRRLRRRGAGSATPGRRHTCVPPAGGAEVRFGHLSNGEMNDDDAQILTPFCGVKFHPLGLFGLIYSLRSRASELCLSPSAKNARWRLTQCPQATS